jgi:translocation and assembly module TamB
VAFADRGDPRLDLRVRSSNFHAFSRADVVDADLSGDLRLDGRWRDARLRGALTADRAIVSIPVLASKDVISLEDPDQLGAVDTLVPVGDRRLGGPKTLLDNLTMQNVPIAMGRDVWLRSSEANINLGGFVNITRGRVVRGRDAGEYRFAFDGPLQTVRGTYRLNLGPVQRAFEVQAGEIRFFGDPDNNPTLDITALHTVRQYSQQGARPDVRVQVHLGGTLLSPTAELSTPDSVRVTNADLISYLVTGGPSYEIAGRGGDYTSTAARVVLSSIGSVLGGKAAGGLCDDAQVSIAGQQQYGGRGLDVGGSILSGTRLSCAKQISDRAYVRLDAGLCQVGQLVTQSGASSPLNLRDAFGIKFDYLLGRDLTASVGVEPPTSAVMCTGNSAARGFVPTPQQIGFDLFRSWRF